MMQELELTFENVLGVYNALWDLGGKLVMNPAVGDHDNWLLTYRDGLRGMLARITAVDRHFLLVHEFQQQQEGVEGNPNEWAMECEYHAGVILFGMDSSLECFVFALNAIGFAISSNDFCNITDIKGLRQIGPKNILCSDPADKRNPKAGYQKFFPRVVSLWANNASLISTIFEYHDVSKHRSAVVQGGRLGELNIKGNPKTPGSLMSSTTHTLQSLARQYQMFIDELLFTALEEGGAAFGYTIIKQRVR